MTFDRLVFWSGIWNIGLGLILVTPPAAQLLGVQIPNPFWPLIVAGFLWYSSATLIVSSRDVGRFASIIYWEALLRFFAVTALLAYGCRRVAGGVVRDHRFCMGRHLYRRGATGHGTVSHVSVAK
jgi:amino acid permease